MVYVDSSRPELVEGFTKKTFTAIIEGVRESALKAGIAEEQDLEAGIQDRYRTAEPDGVFCYTFFKAIGNKEWLSNDVMHSTCALGGPAGAPFSAGGAFGLTGIRFWG